MEITLEQVLGSAVRYIKDRSEEGTDLYFDDLPENFMVPSIYFPVPRTTSRKVTLDSYLTTIRMEAWFMASKDWMAYNAAAGIRDSILLDGMCIGIVSEKGTKAEKAFPVTNPEISRIDTGMVRLSFSAQHYFSAEPEPVIKTEKIVLSGIGKKSFYQTWREATKTQREQEEVQKECLQKALKSL